MVWTAAVFAIGGVAGLVVPSYPTTSIKNNVKHAAFGLPIRFAYTTITSSPSSIQLSSPTSSDISAEIPSDEQTEEQSSISELFDVSEFTDEEIANVQSSPSVSFEDIESDYDDVTLLSSPDMEIFDNEHNYNNNVALTDEEDRILTDREDRLFQYINNTQKIESCILVGVEDLSKARKAKKMNNELEESYTLEESMVEMRELIKTSGLVLQGEITQRLQEVNPRTYIGTGKVKEAQALLDEINSKLEKSGESSCCTVVFVSFLLLLFLCFHI